MHTTTKLPPVLSWLWPHAVVRMPLPDCTGFNYSKANTLKKGFFWILTPQCPGICSGNLPLPLPPLTSLLPCKTRRKMKVTSPPCHLRSALLRNSCIDLSLICKPASTSTAARRLKIFAKRSASLPRWPPHSPSLANDIPDNEDADAALAGKMPLPQMV